MDKEVVGVVGPTKGPVSTPLALMESFPLENKLLMYQRKPKPLKAKLTPWKVLIVPWDEKVVSSPGGVVSAF